MPLLSLGDVPPRAGVVERPEILSVESWLRDPDAGSTLWIHGPPGSGRTTVVASAIRRAGAAGLPAKRVACSAGLSLEEALDELKDFFSQLGSPALANVLDQRAVLCSKVAVLFQALRERPILLWIDDLDALETAMAEARREREPLDYFLEGCRTLEGGASRIILVSRSVPPRECCPSLAIDELSQENAEALWVRLAGCTPTGIRPGVRRDPFIVVLLSCATSRLGAEKVEEMLSSGGDSVDRVLEGVLGHLTPQAIGFLEAASLLPPDPTRQALKEIAGWTGSGIAADDPTLRELEGWGLAALAPEGAAGGAHFLVPQRVRAFVEGRLRLESPDRWRGVHSAIGSYYTKLGAKTSSLWHFLAGWRGYCRAALHDDAYELQKAFLQEMLRRGYLDLARSVLEETVRTATGAARAVTLGNLSIIYKNAGDFTRALDTYGRVHEEFVALGDMLNAARVLHQMGNTHYMKGDYEAALTSYRQSLDLSTRLGDKTVSAATSIQIANVHYQLCDLDEALHEYLHAIAETRALGAHPLTVAVALQISHVYFRSGMYLEAKTYLEEAETSARTCGDLRNLVKVLEAQGSLARERREYDVARERYDAAFSCAESLGDAVEAAAALILAGDLEKVRLQLVEALAAYYRAKRNLDSYAARGAASLGDLEELRDKIEDRIQSMAASLGAETFERVLRRAQASLDGKA